MPPITQSEFTRDVLRIMWVGNERNETLASNIRWQGNKDDI